MKKYDVVVIGSELVISGWKITILETSLLTFLTSPLFKEEFKKWAIPSLSLTCL